MFDSTDTKILVAGGGGFIGGHLAKRLRETTFGEVRAVDKKPLSQWYQRVPEVKSLCLDLSNYEDCRRACEGVTHVFQLAADMGGIGHIEKERVNCMHNAQINMDMLRAAHEAGVDRFLFSSSACVYNAHLQQDPNTTALKESDAYPAQAERGYGWEKLFSENLCQEYWAERGLKTFIARFHNVMGPFGTWDGGREKAPAAICRKVVEAVETGSNTIEIWGDGTRTRSYMYIDDCVEGVLTIMACDDLIATPINLGSSELVSVDQLVTYVEEIAGVKLKRGYDLIAPQGVKGRNSDNTMIKAALGWEPSISLRDGLAKTYKWIEGQYYRRKAGEKVVA